MEKKQLNYRNSAVNTTSIIGVMFLVLGYISTFACLLLLYGSNDIGTIFLSFTPALSGTLIFAICFGISSIIRQLLVIKEQQAILLKHKGIEVEFNE